MQKGWDATGLLRSLWSKPGWNRDKLAEATGIKGTTLSAYNTGSRPLGIKNARKIADALEVSLLDLGAPADLPDSREAEPVLARLERLERDCDDLRAIVLLALKQLDLELVDSSGQGSPIVQRIRPQRGGRAQ